MYQAQYFDEVATDVQKAKEWYKEQQDGLEERFAQAIEDCIVKVLKMPSAYSVRYRNVRIAHPKYFPTISIFTSRKIKTPSFLQALSLTKNKMHCI